jgi:hypothetical protein
VRCDAAKFHYIPELFGGADSRGGRRSSVDRRMQLLFENTKS